MRSLTPEERELWDRVAATIRPLSREPQDKPDKAGIEPGPPRPRPAPPRRAPAIRPQPQRPHSAATLDSTWDRRLRSGSVQPDRVIDLHGMSLDQAWNAIDEGLDRAIASGDRLMLLITGHERSGEPPVQRGKIRSAVHDWLAVSRHSSQIAAVRSAHRRHGGGGSLYIILRRRRPKSTVS